MIAIGTWVVAGGLRYLNTNYDDLTAGLGQVIAGDRAAREAAKEEANTASLAMIANPTYLLVDAPNHEVKTRYAVQSTINTDVQDKAEISTEAFFEHAVNGGRDWTGASVRLQFNGGFNVWVTDIKPAKAEEGSDVAMFSGEIARALRTTSTSPKPIGRRITFRQTQMWDWAITHDDKVYGLYTIRDNLANLPPEIVALATANLSAEAIPADW